MMVDGVRERSIKTLANNLAKGITDLALIAVISEIEKLANRTDAGFAVVEEDNEEITARVRKLEAAAAPIVQLTQPPQQEAAGTTVEATGTTVEGDTYDKNK